jgi:hypothetical protein
MLPKNQLHCQFWQNEAEKAKFHSINQQMISHSPITDQTAIKQTKGKGAILKYFFLKTHTHTQLIESRSKISCLRRKLRSVLDSEKM